MLHNALENFLNNIYLFLIERSDNIRGLLVKKHNENLQTHGDYSFSNSPKCWKGFVDYDKNNTEKEEGFLEIIGKKAEDLVELSKNWDLCVSKVKEEKGRVYLFLERPRAFRVGLLDVLNNNELILQRIRGGTSVVELDPLVQGKHDLTSLRAQCFYYAVKNLCAVCNVDSAVFVTSKSSSKSDSKILMSGPVLNARNGAKETDLDAGDFIRLRLDEMKLIAQHKYGLRVSTESKWKGFIAHLGESAVMFELLQTKVSSPVRIDFESSLVGASKGVSFILYNCARLETILRTYNEKVTEGTYPPLSDFDNTDFALLTQEDEWCLTFNYILGLPVLLNNCVDINENMCEFRPHHICSFLSSMVRVFSQYYRRVRILTEPRNHLVPVMFARIHMLIALKNTLKTCLKLLNIKSASQM